MMDPSMRDFLQALTPVLIAIGGLFSAGNNNRLEKIKKVQTDIKMDQQALTILIDSGVKQQLDAHLIDFKQHIADDDNRDIVLLGRMDNQDTALKDLDIGLNGGLAKATEAAKEVINEAVIRAEAMIKAVVASYAVELAEEKERASLMVCAAQGCQILQDDIKGRGCPVINIHEATTAEVSKKEEKQS